MLLLLTTNVIDARCGSMSTTSGALERGCRKAKHNVHSLSWAMPFFEIKPAPSNNPQLVPSPSPPSNPPPPVGASVQCGHRALALVLRAHLLGRRGRLSNVAKLLCFPREQKKCQLKSTHFWVLAHTSWKERVCVCCVARR
jgi:hypothetical protein